MDSYSDRGARVAVVVPSFRAGTTIAAVVRQIGPEVSRIYVVDDGCPDQSGEHALRECADPRLTVLHTNRNLGVGGAMKQGYRRASADGADIVVKIDADGQMDPVHIERLIAPIRSGAADYAKGNRFACASLMPMGPLQALGTMPRRRRLANRALALVHGFATGYWNVADPANGYTAVAVPMLNSINLNRVADCFFFETDMLHRLHLAAARVVEVPLPATYPGSGSTLSLSREAARFPGLIAHRTLRRLCTQGHRSLVSSRKRASI